MFHDQLLTADERAKYHETYGRMADAVQECLHSYLWVAEEVRRACEHDGRDIHATPLMLMMEFAEPIDGVVSLVRVGSSRNCTQLLRTAFEIGLALKYMFAHKDTYEQRCLAYEFFHLRERLRWAQRCDPDNPVGRQLRVEIAGHELADIFDVTGVDIKKEISSWEAKVNSDRYKAVRAELDDMRAKKRRAESWFALWGGPASVRDLAYHLREGPRYEIFYRTWSTTTHGAGALRRITGQQDAALNIHPLRSPCGLPAACRNACFLTNELVPLFVDGLVPALRPAMAERYISRIKPGLAFIDSVKGLSE